jgi:hypothetical protein
VILIGIGEAGRLRAPYSTVLGYVVSTLEPVATGFSEMSEQRKIR